MTTITIVRTDPHMPVDDEWAKGTCKIGQGSACCRYLTIGGKGWSCVKSDPELGPYVDGRAAAGTMAAISDNCTGRLFR